MYFLNSETFLLWLQELTGIKEKLISDPYLSGGGFHEINTRNERMTLRFLIFCFYRIKKFDLKKKLEVCKDIAKSAWRTPGGHGADAHSCLSY